MNKISRLIKTTAGLNGIQLNPARQPKSIQDRPIGFLYKDEEFTKTVSAHSQNNFFARLNLRTFPELELKNPRQATRLANDLERYFRGVNRSQGGVVKKLANLDRTLLLEMAINNHGLRVSHERARSIRQRLDQIHLGLARRFLQNISSTGLINSENKDFFKNINYGRLIENLKNLITDIDKSFCEYKSQGKKANEIVIANQGKLMNFAKALSAYTFVFANYLHHNQKFQQNSNLRLLGKALLRTGFYSGAKAYCDESALTRLEMAFAENHDFTRNKIPEDHRYLERVGTLEKYEPSKFTRLRLAIYEDLRDIIFDLYKLYQNEPSQAIGFVNSHIDIFRGWLSGVYLPNKSITERYIADRILDELIAYETRMEGEEINIDKLLKRLSKEEPLCGEYDFLSEGLPTSINSARDDLDMRLRSIYDKRA